MLQKNKKIILKKDSSRSHILHQTYICMAQFLTRFHWLLVYMNDEWYFYYYHYYFHFNSLVCLFASFFFFFLVSTELHTIHSPQQTNLRRKLCHSKYHWWRQQIIKHTKKTSDRMKNFFYIYYLIQGDQLKNGNKMCCFFSLHTNYSRPELTGLELREFFHLCFYTIVDK